MLLPIHWQNPMLPRIVTRSSSVCQPRPTASRTGVPARPRTPTPGPDHPGGLTSFSKSDALLVETDLSKRAHYNKEVSTAPNLSKPITKAFERYILLFIEMPQFKIQFHVILAELYMYRVYLIYYRGQARFHNIPIILAHTHALWPDTLLLLYLYDLPCVTFPVPQ